jgi:hypothetical protein
MRRIVSIVGLGFFSAAIFAASCLAQDKVIGEVFTSDASVHGSVVFVGGGTQIAGGSTVASGSATTVVRLTRGGEVRLCSGTAMTLNASPKGNGLLLSMDSGDVELHYALRSSADTLVTPDFRITLAGPGEFHVAFGADRRGNTCLRTLKGNNSSLLVAEVFGDGVYQVKPDERINFHGGKVSDATDDPEPCGCPAPAPVIQADNKPPGEPKSPPVPDPKAEVKPDPVKPAATLASPEASTAGSSPLASAQINATPPPAPASDPNRPVADLTVETPFVFNAAGLPGPPVAAPPPEVVPLPRNYRADVPAATYLKNADQVVDELPQYSVLQASFANPPKAKPEKRGFFGRLKSFFAAVFK